MNSSEKVQENRKHLKIIEKNDDFNSVFRIILVKENNFERIVIVDKKSIHYRLIYVLDEELFELDFYLNL